METLYQTTNQRPENNEKCCSELQINCEEEDVKEIDITNDPENISVQTINQEDGDPYFKYKISKQICLVIVWICMGLTSEMSGPTLPDLKDRIGVNYEEISRSMVGKSIGMLLGSVLGGYLHSVITPHADLLNSLSLMLMSIAAFLLPWSTSVETAAIVFFVHGIGHGSVQIGGNTMVMHLWQKNAASAIHSLQFGFGVGALISPQIASPFLSSKDNNGNSNSSSFTSPEELFSQNLSRIEIPYSIAGIFVFLFSLVILGFYLKGAPDGFPERKRSKLSEMTSPGSCTSGNHVFGIIIFISLFNYFLHAVGGEKAYGKFLFSYAYEQNILSKKKAYLLQSTFWFSFSIGRLSGVLLCRYLAVRTVIIGDLFIVLLSTAFLAEFAHSEPVVLWIFTVTIGMAIARMYPNGMAWANLHLTMNSMGVLVFVIGGALGDFLYQYLTGYLFEHTGPHALMYVMVGYGICLTCACVLIAVVVKVIPHKNAYDITVEIEIKGD